MCRMLLKVITEVAEDLYNLHTVTLILSVGTISDSLQLLDILDEDDGL